MSNLPKLKVTWRLLGREGEETTCDLEQMQDVFDNRMVVFTLEEGEMLRTYEDLVELVAQDRYKDKEFLAILVTTVAGGG